MNHPRKSPAIALLIAACLLSGGAYANGIDMNCVGGDDASDIQDEIDAAVGPTIIIFKGSCLGDISINRDDITIKGKHSAETDQIVGRVVIQGAQRIQLENLTITGGASGIIAYDGAALRAEDITVSGTTGSFAVGVFNGSTVILTDAEISDNDGRGVLASANATVEVRGVSTVSDNDRDGFGIFKGSSLTLGSSMSVESIEVKKNGDRGINVGENSSVDVREKTTISENTLHGIHAFAGASVFINGAKVYGGDSHAFTATQSRVFITKSNSVPPVKPVIDGLTGGKGLTLAYGASAEIEDATINSNYIGEFKRALTLISGSMALVRRSVLTSPNTDETVYIEEGSTVEFVDSRIDGSGRPDSSAVYVVYGGTVRFRSTDAGSSEINNPSGWMAVVVNYGSRMVLEEGHDTFNGSIFVGNGSVADIKNATINGNIQIENNSLLRLRNRAAVGTSTNVTNIVNPAGGNVHLVGDSLLEFKAKSPLNRVVVTGNVTCADGESSVSNLSLGDLADHAIVGGHTCTGF